MTYWVGMTPTQCNSTSHELTASPSLETKIARKMVIKPRFVSVYEACYWVITAADTHFAADSTIDIWINRTNRGEYWIYEGSDRHNVTTVVANNASAYERDAPYRVPVNSGAIVVFMTEKAGASSSRTYGGSGQFSYKISGGTYAFYERPFVNQPKYIMKAAIYGSIGLALLCMLVFCCICCGCCRDKSEFIEKDKSPARVSSFA